MGQDPCRVVNPLLRQHHPQGGGNLGKGEGVGKN